MPTECSAERFDFGLVGRREVVGSFDGGAITSSAQEGELCFAHLKRILKLDRLRLRGPCGAHDEFLLAATALNLRKLAKLIP
jgi:hypothetical protein